MSIRRQMTLWLRHRALFVSLTYPRQEHPLKKLRMVRKGDAAVIDGYPRSANTFATVAFLQSQEAGMKVGNHLHNPQQFHRARAFGIPAMLVLREPKAACLSHMVLSHWNDPCEALDRYIAFHRDLPSDDSSFVVAPFEEVTTNFGASIARMNNHFGTRFAPFEHDEKSEEKVKAGIIEARQKRLDEFGADYHDEFGLTLPTAAKTARREELLAEFDRPEAVAALARATEHYQRLLKLAD